MPHSEYPVILKKASLGISHIVTKRFFKDIIYSKPIVLTIIVVCALFASVVAVLVCVEILSLIARLLAKYRFGESRCQRHRTCVVGGIPFSAKDVATDIIRIRAKGCYKLLSDTPLICENWISSLQRKTSGWTRKNF